MAELYTGKWLFRARCSLEGKKVIFRIAANSMEDALAIAHECVNDNLVLSIVDVSHEVLVQKEEE